MAQDFLGAYHILVKLTLRALRNNLGNYSGFEVSCNERNQADVFVEVGRIFWKVDRATSYSSNSEGDSQNERRGSTKRV